MASSVKCPPLSSENVPTPDRYLATGPHKACRPPLPFPVRPGLLTASPTREAFLFRVNMKDLSHAPSPDSSRMVARAQLPTSATGVPMSNTTLTAIDGLLAGHATDDRNHTGCTAILCPQGFTPGCVITAEICHNAPEGRA